MDFIESLLLSQGFNTILVKVDMYTKYWHFMALNLPYIVANVAQMFLILVFKLHKIS